MTFNFFLNNSRPVWCLLVASGGIVEFRYCFGHTRFAGISSFAVERRKNVYKGLQLFLPSLLFWPKMRQTVIPQISAWWIKHSSVPVPLLTEEGKWTEQWTVALNVYAHGPIKKSSTSSPTSSPPTDSSSSTVLLYCALAISWLSGRRGWSECTKTAVNGILFGFLESAASIRVRFF